MRLPGPQRLGASLVSGGQDTPITDLLYEVTGGEPMPTWNRQRGRLEWGQRRVAGGEWDYIRELPLRTRRVLTGAGYMRLRAMYPDEFAELLRNHPATNLEGACDTDCHAWFVRHALAAIRERRTAHHYNRHLAVARASGHRTYYARRVELVGELGYPSLWAYRKAQGWE